MITLHIGAAAFGIVIGWMTYRTLAHKKKPDWSDLSTVIATVGGAAVLSLFPAQTPLFGAYAIGLFVGFFGFYCVYLIIARKARISWLNIILGEKTDALLMGDTDRPRAPGRD